MRDLAILGLMSCLAAASLGGCATNGPAPRIVRYQGEDYRLLRGEALRSAVVGSSFGYRPSPEDVVINRRCDVFDADGRTYYSCSDRVPRTYGTYRVREDRFCATVYSRCWSLFRSRGGEYLLRTLHNGQLYDERICVERTDQPARCPTDGN